MADIGSLEFELNRLAETLVDGRASLGAAAAANQIAGTSGLEVVGALNAFLDISPDQALGLDGACREMALIFAPGSPADGLGAASSLSLITTLTPPAPAAK
jgi:hypothetical protein